MERIKDMRKLSTVFTVMILVCTFSISMAATPPAFTGIVSVESKTVKPGDSFTLKVWLTNNNYPTTALRVPLRFSSSYVTCNYIDFGGSLKQSNMEGYFIINGTSLEFSYIPDVVYPLPFFANDSGLLATLYLTASASAPDISVAVDSANRDSTFEIGGQTYHIWRRIEFSDTDGTTLLPDFIAGTVEIRHSTDIALEEGMLPTTLSLAQNYPNPFNPVTSISFSLPTRSHVRIEVFNLLGQKVTMLADGEFPSGEHKVEWNAENAPSGIYFYRMTADGKSLTRKMLLMK